MPNFDKDPHIGRSRTDKGINLGIKGNQTVELNLIHSPQQFSRESDEGVWRSTTSMGVFVEAGAVLERVDLNDADGMRDRLWASLPAKVRERAGVYRK